MYTLFGYDLIQVLLGDDANYLSVHYIGRVIVITSEEDENKLKLEASVLAICNKNIWHACQNSSTTSPIEAVVVATAVVGGQREKIAPSFITTTWHETYCFC